MTTRKFNRVIKEIIKEGGHPYLVGGAVRDLILGIQSKDFDIEVFGLTSGQLIEALIKIGKPNIDDKKFGVIRLDCDLTEAVEFTLPRRDNKGKRGFGGIFPDLSAREAARRRDFTFNAISQSLVTNEVIDPLNGVEDLKAGIIRHCDDIFFGQDPLRAIRGFRFAGLLDAEVSNDTKVVIRDLIPQVKELSPSALWTEFEKWAKRSIRPSRGLKFMIDTGLIECFPEIEALVGCQQDPIWHPEGDTFEHTCHVVDAAAGQRVVVVLAALCHDFGKPETTVNNQGQWISPGHAKAGETPTRSFLRRIGAPKKITNQVVKLVKEHMIHAGSGKVSKRQARRLLVRLNDASIDDLFKVIEADCSGRPPLGKGLPKRAKELQIECGAVSNEIKPILQGRHLIAIGMNPGHHFGPVLKKAFEAQIDGLFNCPNGGIKWLRDEELI